MNRKGFPLYVAAIYVVSRLPWYGGGAVFKVTSVDPHGSGMDYSGHLGCYVYNAKRCCKNCETIFAAFAPGGDVDNGPQFYWPELTPINGRAKRLMAEVLVSHNRSAKGSTSFALAE